MPTSPVANSWDRIVADPVEPAARALAETEPDRTAFAFARPAIIDCTNRQTYSFEGRSYYGAVYNSWLRQRPATVAT